MPNEKPVIGQYSPMWRGTAGSGSDRVYSIDGKWVKAGQRLSSGHKVVGEDKNGNLILGFNGIPVTIGMQGSHITPYNEQSKPMWTGAGQDSYVDEQLAGSFRNPDGTFGDMMGGTHDTMESASKAFQTYFVKNRTGIDSFINKMKKENPNVNYGTYSDYMNASPEQQAQGFRVFNNETGDFTDLFKSAPSQ